MPASAHKEPLFYADRVEMRWSWRELIREDQKRRERERLDMLLLEGLDSGDPILASPEFWRTLKQEGLAKLKSRKKPKK